MMLFQAVIWLSSVACLLAAPVSNTSTPTTPSSNTKIKSTPTAAHYDKPMIGSYILLTHTYVASPELKRRCSLSPTDEDAVYRIKQSLDRGSKLIKYHLKIDDPDRKFVDRNSNIMHKPFTWVRSTGRHGLGLLLLRPEYDVLSLTTLEIGVATLNISLKEDPPGCLSNVTYPEAETLFRQLIMNDFQNASQDVLHIHPSDSVCNQHITDMDGTAKFQYFCCQRDDVHHVKCGYLQTDIWLQVLLAIITILKVLVILFSPRFVPDSFYRKKHIALPYVHTLSPEDPMVLRTTLTKQPERYRSKNVIKISKFRYMKEFKKVLNTMKLDIPLAYTIQKLHLSVKSSRLLNEKYAPVGIFETLYASFVKCGIRDRPSVAECCKANVCLKLPFSKTLTWYRVLKEAMKFVLLIIFAMPWLIRVYVYFRYEDNEMQLQKSLAEEKRLKFKFPGNWTLYLTPLHVVFILIYVLLSFESFIFGVLRKRTKEKFKFVLRKCFRDMRELNKMDVMGWSIRNLVKPCVMCGALGICLGLVSWIFLIPLIASVLAFYLLPTLNVTLRLLAHFVVYLVPQNVCSSYIFCKRISDFLASAERTMNMERLSAAEKLEKDEKVLSSFWKRVQQLVVIFLCLISMYSVIFLLLEFVSFFVEIFVYTLMGLIVNATTTMTYVSLSLLLGVYGNDCFGSVTNKFLGFNKTLNGAILKLGKEKVENVAYKSETSQGNNTFTVASEHNTEIKRSVELITSCDGLSQPRWNFSRLLLFLSKKDEPLIPRTLFFKSCKMPFYAVPGELLLNYLRAAMEFSSIIIFLMFVLIVVLAFGDTYEISATNQLLATIAGGFVPFMLRNIVFKSHKVTSVDTSCIPFQVCLNDVIESYQQSWPIEDIHVTQAAMIVSNGMFSDPPTTVVAKHESPEEEPFLNDSVIHSEGLRKIGTPLDLVIDARVIDVFDFPDMNCERSPSNRDIGSMSFLDDFDEDIQETVS